MGGKLPIKGIKWYKNSDLALLSSLKKYSHEGN